MRAAERSADLRDAVNPSLEAAGKTPVLNAPAISRPFRHTRNSRPRWRLGAHVGVSFSLVFPRLRSSLLGRFLLRRNRFNCGRL